MDRAKLKLMVRNLELLVDDIKAEVFSDVESYVVHLQQLHKIMMKS